MMSMLIEGVPLKALFSLSNNRFNLILFIASKLKTSKLNFHGDVPIGRDKIDQVLTNRSLLNDRN